MPDKPLVSFCFTTYKRKDFLRSTLLGIMRQTYPVFEVIISDNDPEQSARPVVEEFDIRFKYFPNAENLGMKKSYNRSLERSSGDFIVMIADDDPVYPDMLETLVDLFQQFPLYGMYLGGCDWFCSDLALGKMNKLKIGTNSCLTDKYEYGYIKAFTPDDFLSELFSLKIFPHYLWSTCMVKKDILVYNGGVPDYGTPFLGDYAYLSACGAHSGCVIINKALGCQTLHKENFGRQQNRQIAEVLKKFPVFIEAKAGHLSHWKEIKERMYRFVALWAVTHMSFLNRYYNFSSIKGEYFREAEREVFSIRYMKKYRLKYFLKKRLPAIHDVLVKAKSVFRRK